MSLRINSEAPDFTAETTQGTISFNNWIGSSWAILFSHLKDFTPVCTTELGYMAALKPHFDQRNTKIIGLSVDPVANHGRWAKDIEETQGHYDDAIRDTFIAQKRQYHIRRTDDTDFLTQLQRAADWLYARKVLPGQVRITDCVATV
jgi:alkyl hydroperoxide reductase subunit AhpC